MVKKKNCNVMRINIYYIENENYCICIKRERDYYYFLFRKFVHVMVNNFYGNENDHIFHHGNDNFVQNLSLYIFFVVKVMSMIIFLVMVMIILLKISLYIILFCC